MDTVVNVGVGGAANVAMDYAFAKVDALASLGGTTKKAIKIAVGAIGGAMTTNKYLRAAADGIATVGASELISSYIDTPATTEGLPEGTIGRVRHLGQRGFKRAKVAGMGGASFMSC